jgi:hypothetical protein
MSSTATLSSRFQISIPKAVRDAHFEGLPGVVLVPRSPSH